MLSTEPEMCSLRAKSDSSKGDPPISLIGKYCLQIINQELIPGGSDGQESACNAGDPGLISGQEDPPEKGMATHSHILP